MAALPSQLSLLNRSSEYFLGVMPLSWVVIAARNLRVRHVTFQEFACIRTKNLIQSQACHSLCYVCGDVYVYGAPATTIQGRRKVFKYGGSISHTMYFELGGVCSKIQQTKMLVTCQRFDDLLLFGLISLIRKHIIQVGSKSQLLTCTVL